MKKQLAAQISLIALMIVLSRAEEAQAQKIKERLEKKSFVGGRKEITPAVETKITRRIRTRSSAGRMRERARRYEPLIAAAAARYQVDPRALWTIAYLETRFRPDVVSTQGARGLMQFMPATARAYGLRNPHKPAQAIDAAARHVKVLSARYDNRLDLVLASYHAGETAVDAYFKGAAISLPSGKVINHRGVKTNGIPPYSGTRKYVTRGLSVYSRVAGSEIFEASLLAQSTPLAIPTANPQNQEMAYMPAQEAELPLDPSTFVASAAQVAASHHELRSMVRALRPRIVGNTKQTTTTTTAAPTLKPESTGNLASATRARIVTTQAEVVIVATSEENRFFDMHSGEHYVVSDHAQENILSSELEAPQQRMMREDIDPKRSVRDGIARDTTQRQRSVYGNSFGMK